MQMFFLLFHSWDSLVFKIHHPAFSIRDRLSLVAIFLKKLRDWEVGSNTDVQGRKSSTSKIKAFIFPSRKYYYRDTININLGTYILKAKKLADSAFKSKIIGGKIA